MFTQFNSFFLRSHNLILPAQMNPCKIASQCVQSLFYRSVTQMVGKRLCKFLFVNGFTVRCWPPRCWDPFFAISCTLPRFLFEVCAGGILQLCVVSCIVCCDLAFGLPAWMTETSELERTDCQPLDMKQSCSLTNNHILVWVTVLLWKWVFACALELTETWRMASCKCGMQHAWPKD